MARPSPAQRRFWPLAGAALMATGLLGLQAVEAAYPVGGWSIVMWLLLPLAAAWLVRRAMLAAGAAGGSQRMIRTVVPVWQRQIESTRAEAEREFGELLGRVVAVSDRLDSLVRQPHASEASALAQSFEDLQVSLQYQDRLSQRLDHLAHDMARFGTTDHEAADDQAARRWLAVLAAGYTTDEQRREHPLPAFAPSADADADADTGAAPSPDPRPAGDAPAPTPRSSGVEFF